MGKSTVDKPPKFSGKDFKRWQSKMLFFLKDQRLDEVSLERPSRRLHDRGYEDRLDRWTRKNYMCKNHILNCLDDSLYDFYNAKENFTAFDLWEALEEKYLAEAAGSKKFLVARFLEYKMTDEKPVVEQFVELHLLINEILAEGMHIDESLQVSTVIEKLPPSWNEYKRRLRHKNREITMVELGKKIQVEELLCCKDKILMLSKDMSNKAHVLYDNAASKKRQGESSKNGKHNKQRNSKGNHLKPKGGVSKNTIKGDCCNCGKTGHMAKDCRAPKKTKNDPKQKNKANVVDDSGYFTGMVSEVNLVSNVTNVRDWWLDSGATRHVCKFRNAFSSYKKVGDDEKLFMGNSSTSKVVGKGKVEMKLTSGKTLALNDVYHVPDICKNLISETILLGKGFKFVAESNKVVISKGGDFVGKRICH